MKWKKGLESIVSLIPWILLAVVFVVLVVLFVTNKFDTLGELIRRVLPIPG